MKRVILIFAIFFLALATMAQVSYKVKDHHKASPDKWMEGSRMDAWSTYLGPPVDDLNKSAGISPRPSYLGPPVNDLDKSKGISPRPTHLGPPSNDLLTPEKLGPKSPHYIKPVANHKSTRDVSFRQLGQAGNAYGFFGNGRTYLWADDRIESVSFMHRMSNPPGTGYLAYDLSTDGGYTWQNNIQVYDPTLSEPGNARYPQGGIYNPLGNTDPDNAYFAYFAPTLDGSNTSGELDWGGYCFGVHKLDQSQPPTQHNQASEGYYYQQIPYAFTITQDGVLWMVDANELSLGGGDYQYTDEMIVGKAIFNNVTNDYDYEQFLFDAPINPDEGVNDIKIAFSPDGQTGYIMMLSEIEPMTYTSYHPILYMTTDGGESWEEDPIEVELGGPDGIEAIKNWLSDEMLEGFFEPPIPPRDSIAFYAGYHGDLVVDFMGNPHITVMIAIAGDGVFYYPSEYIATFHIYSLDGGETWDARHLKTLQTFKGEFAGGGETISMTNQPQAGITMDGTRIFFSCLDTDFEGLETNTNPDIYVTAYSIYGDVYSECVNVTQYTQAWLAAWYGTISHYVFSEINGNSEICTIPLVYEELDPTLDPTLPVSFWYIDHCQFEFPVTVGTDETPVSHLTVTQNYPNPFSDQTYIQVKVDVITPIEVHVYNTTGQLVLSERIANASAGTHIIPFDASTLGTGVYFYHVTAQNETVTKKMIVQ